MKVVFNRGNEYFDTYHVLDDSGKLVGMVEDHCRQVKTPYFVGWKLDAPSGKPLTTGETQHFDNREDAIKYAAGK